MTEFKGQGVILFYDDGFCQGRLIKDKESPYSLVGQLLSEHVDPNQNDCMEPNDFYKVIIKSTIDSNVFELVLRRERMNDASDLFTDETDLDYQFHFKTAQFLSGQKALHIQNTYFKPYPSDLVACLGDIEFII